MEPSSVLPVRGGREGLGQAPVQSSVDDGVDLLAHAPNLAPPEITLSPRADATPPDNGAIEGLWRPHRSGRATGNRPGRSRLTRVETRAGESPFG